MKKTKNIKPDFDCPRCGLEPGKGIFLNSRIYHDACLVEELVEQYYNGIPEEKIKKTLMIIKNKRINMAVSIGCSWMNYPF